MDNLAEKLYYHNYFIGRQEAAEIGLKIVRPADALETAMWQLLKAYREEMELGHVFDPAQHLGQKEDARIERPIAILDSVGLRSCFRKQLWIRRRIVDVSGTAELVFEEHNIPWCSESVVDKEGVA